MCIMVDLLNHVNSLVVECWFIVWEVQDSIQDKGPCHTIIVTKDIKTMVPVVPLFSTQH